MSQQEHEPTEQELRDYHERVRSAESVTYDQETIGETIAAELERLAERQLPVDMARVYYMTVRELVGAGYYAHTWEELQPDQHDIMTRAMAQVRSKCGLVSRHLPRAMVCTTCGEEVTLPHTCPVPDTSPNGTGDPVTLRFDHTGAAQAFFSALRAGRLCYVDENGQTVKIMHSFNRETGEAEFQVGEAS